MPGTEQGPSSEVQIWSTVIDMRAEFEPLLRMLSDDERARASRFRFETDRISFAARRGFARKVLARYTGVAAARIGFRASRQGKPELDPPCGVFFNVSHSDRLAVIAVASQPLVGVDIERLRPMPDALELAHRFFSPREIDRIRSVPRSSRSEEFLMLWTRKESYVKAVGEGLAMPLDAFDVSDQQGGQNRPAQGPRGDLPFVSATLNTPPGFVGTVTLSGTRLATRDMTPAAVRR